MARPCPEFAIVTRIASIDLSDEHVPDDVDAGESGLGAVVTFAQTFNGYAWGGGPHVLGERVARVRSRWSDGGELPTDLDLLRACLFHWARARDHGYAGPTTADDRAWLNALLAAIRDTVAGR